jgi:aspartate/methionine/tyrosine aminotransferase
MLLLQVVLGPCCPHSLHPDWSWLQQQLAGPQPPKMVVLVNPCNPTGEASIHGCSC